MKPAQNLTPFILRTFSFDVGKWRIEPAYWHVGVILFLIFLLVLTLARVRHMYIGWSMGKHNWSFLFYGFLLTVILEGFLLIGGRTLFTEIIGWKNAPKPISTALDAGRAKLVKVLGVTEEIPESVASEFPTYQSLVSDYQNLSPQDAKMAKSFICQP